MITNEEYLVARKMMEFAIRNGADAVRVSVDKSCLDLVGTHNGEIEKITHALDRSMRIAIFAEERFGTYSINRLEGEELYDFVLRSIATTKMIGKDADRGLQDPSKTAKDAITGLETKLYDATVEAHDSDVRLSLAESSACFGKLALPEGISLLSEETEYSECVSETLVIDSNGLYCRQKESSFEIGCEVTIEDADGNLFSDYWWDASPMFKTLSPSISLCSKKAVERAVQQIGPIKIEGGKMNMVLDTEVASKLLTPLLSALGGSALQQKNSFLEDSIGKRIFSSKLNVIDMPRVEGICGARMFDNEGTATFNAPIIENGVVKEYFLSSYYARKLGMEATVEDAMRVVVEPFGGCKDVGDMMKAFGEGVLVTGFNGGNRNNATGNFSYGVQGFYFKDGKILHPVREMLITGNLIELWNNIEYAGEDARPCATRSIPTLGFSNVNFR